MARARTGDVLYCEVCGLTVIVDEECGCADTGVICCEETMINKGPAPSKPKPAAKKAKAQNTKPAKKKPAKKAVKKTAKKASAKKKPVKKKKK
ncbi:MAG TPA: hypothetical protein ENN23_02355 [Deltaproteobacteria bacterium]|nr:hypothetical protein [Deltaproteobacteria bacterium]